ncbi:hypothetical protein [Anaerocolumna jejuensis]|uniref:hypothetical protein n=1 Tax=Anaerocolumna jejuensis TaxID=259063 RepID=UPI00093267A6|nr:hypothetical protein [Anaerocolumna jejuensis]
MKEKLFHSIIYSSTADLSAVCNGSNVKEKRFHSIIYGSTADLSALCNGSNVKEKRFHIPLFMAVPQTCLRYAMRASGGLNKIAINGA